MLPYQTLITLRRASASTLSQQLTAAFIQLIQQGLLPAKAKLSGTRSLAQQLGISRQTAITAFDELAAQGWIEQHASSGAFVRACIPIVQPQALPGLPAEPGPARAGFAFARRSSSTSEALPDPTHLVLGAGCADHRLAPLASLARKYRSVCQRPNNRRLFGYTEPSGSRALRQHLAHYLHDTRGVQAQPETLFITRGSGMAMYLVAQLLLQPGDAVIVGDRSYSNADELFEHHGAHLVRVPVDAQGISVNEVEAACQRQAIRLLYITPHHHYPTTVTLVAERRVRLLQLAEQYDFVVLEDDYDFDFHYASSPILPLASADRHGRVLYVGSLSKVLAPAFRVGYVVGPPDLIAEMGYLRHLIDHQGDTLLEQGIAELFAEGELLAHLKRANKIYQQRRDVFCELLHTHLAGRFSFTLPEGGMAVWGEFAPDIDLPQLSAQCRQQGLWLSDGRRYQTAAEARPSHLRLGFAALTVEELTQSVHILAKALQATS
ncbi:MocR-like pyridoxine biosynthesis transcription factor PdxR [Hymenobacter volaticus]|nr:PLP-dependent aminotransferase family protein [Hymenobacter volaticus]